MSVTFRIPFLKNPGPLISNQLGIKHPSMAGVIQSIELRAMAFLYGEKSQLHNIIVDSFEFDFLTQDTRIDMVLFNIGFTAAQVSYVVHRFFVK